MEKYLLLKLGMNILEVEKVLEQKIILEQQRPDLKGFYFSNYILGTYLSFTNEKNLSFISFKSPFSLAIDGITIGMNMNEVEKIKGLPEKKNNCEDYPEQEEWIFYSKNTAYLFVENKVYDISLCDFEIEQLLDAIIGDDNIEDDDFENCGSFDIGKNNEIKIANNMEKYLLLKLGINLSEVEKVLKQTITLERNTCSPDSKGFNYLNDTIGTYLSFTEDKILEHISFSYPFSLVVDGIKIGMNMNEVEKIKGIPEKREYSENFQEMEEWLYYSKNTAYLFIDKKIYDISHHNFEVFLTKDDIEVLVNAVSGTDKIENGDIVFSSSFDNDKSDEIKYYDK